MRTLVDLLMQQADRCGDRRAFTFLADDDRESTISYRELDRRARSIAVHLARFAEPGQRALLVYPTGIEFIAAFFGCVYAGVLPVPATFPKPRRPMPRPTAIASDCDATLALTTAASLATLDLSLSPQLQGLNWIATDDELGVARRTNGHRHGVGGGVARDESATGDLWRPPAVDANDLCFLQYTSGSTSEPKGVMVSHANLLANMELILFGNGVRRLPGENPGRTGVFWIPAYHDMGLICGILGAVYEGGHSVLMTPTSFLKRPLRWLQTIEKYRAEVSGAPNFAYELCVRKTTPHEREALDLSSWRVAFCSAEPVRPETLEQFATSFADGGFSSDAFYPCYGLAEATLLAAGNEGPGRPVVKHICRSALAEHRWLEADENSGAGDAGDSNGLHVRLVGCGGELLDQQLAIVDPHTHLQINGGSIGEIWIKGPCVAQGYWGRREETQRIFRARLADTGDGPYLRTGDLGILHQGQLFVTGRVKDVIIIRGRNHYPHDIEHTVEAAHPALLHGAGCAFAVESDTREQLVVVHEIDRHYRDADLDEVIRAMRAAIAEEHDLELAAAVLIRQASLPRTTSGKTQRNLCRELFQSGSLKTLAVWRPSTVEQRDKPAHIVDDARISPLPRHGRPLEDDEIDRLAERIEEWLLEWLIERAGVPGDDVARDRPFAEYGLDSLTAVELSQELEDWLGVHLSSVIAWKYPTPVTLARYLAREAGGASTAAEHVPGALRKRNAGDFLRILSEVESMSDADVQREHAPREFSQEELEP
ncbi:MAG: AMP-binding protein [Pirellulaceae bacterium]